MTTAMRAVRIGIHTLVFLAAVLIVLDARVRLTLQSDLDTFPLRRLRVAW